MQIIELGCGNGRDSIYFSQKGLTVLGVDQVSEEVTFLNGKYSTNKLKFCMGDFTRLPSDESYDCVYSRFTLHSVTDADEDRVFNWVRHALRENGLFALEVRSMSDPKRRQGTRVSPSENIVDGHYRRYAELSGLLAKLSEVGLAPLFSEESTGFAPHGDEDPPVIRVVAQL
ncbi:MAG: class I SAM-dependent methyltransferase [Verrucomicrobia bacterium]|nr:class I SAM-dependent methyltransferase [Verrucomicrobiota bacterium]MBT7700348.1 class I SAM-dependent methyltransferase [Verrucomicrobiota bacterium]